MEEMGEVGSGGKMKDIWGGGGGEGGDTWTRSGWK